MNEGMSNSERMMCTKESKEALMEHRLKFQDMMQASDTYLKREENKRKLVN